MKNKTNIKVICTNTPEDFKLINEKYTLLLAELFLSGQLDSLINNKSNINTDMNNSNNLGVTM